MKHECHAHGCAVAVPPSMVMCRPHWWSVRKALRDAIWREYRRGQERDKRPSARYMAVQRWGATNNPERISMPMLRRFSKVLIVGELTNEDRVALLKQFSRVMPLDRISDEEWSALAQRLEGATGDVIRKIVDHVWREKMSEFVRKHPVVAVKCVEFLNGGEKFTISTFSDAQRESLHEMLAPHVRVRARDLDESVTLHLENVAVHAEIATAVATYKRAREFLSRIRAKSIRTEDTNLIEVVKTMPSPVGGGIVEQPPEA